MSTDFRALCAELVETLAEHQDRLEDSYHPDHSEADRLDRSFRLLERARAALAQPEPVAPSDEDLYDLAEVFNGEPVASMRRALARWGTPTAQSVPVSERPWEREGWCDAEGMCWWGHPSDDETNAGWVPGTWKDVEVVGLDSFTASLPHWALPMPANTTTEEI